MLRDRVALPGTALRVGCRIAVSVAASVAAILVASAVFTPGPNRSVPVERPIVELTSGGKFAARVAGAEAVTRPVERAARSRLLLPLRSEARGLIEAAPDALNRPAELAAAALGSKSALSVEESGATKTEGGIMARLASSMRSLWPAPSSAGAR